MNSNFEVGHFTHSASTASFSTPASASALRIASMFIEIVERPGSAAEFGCADAGDHGLAARNDSVSPISVPLEIGFAFLAKRLRALLRILGLAQHPTDQLLDAQSRVDVGVARADASSFAACTASGALAAIRSAYSRAEVISSLCGTTLLIKPQRAAVAGVDRHHRSAASPCRCTRATAAACVACRHCRR